MPRSIQIGLAIVLLGVCAGAVHAADVRMRTEGGTAYVGVGFPISIEVSYEDNHTPPVLGDIENAKVIGPSQQQNDQVRVINGRVSRQRTVVYSWEIVPEKEGQIRIPSVRVVADGRAFRTKETVYPVQETGSDGYLFVEVKPDRDTIYFGESVEATLEVWILPYDQGGIDLDERDMWGLVQFNRSIWGAFEEGVSAQPPRVRVSHRSRTGDDGVAKTYYVYTVSAEVWPEKTGAVNFDDIRVVMQYPLRIVRDRGFTSFFGDLRVSQSQTLVVSPTETTLSVLPVPKEGKPNIYRGAVGSYRIAASASPTEVSVGEPITLNLTVRGDGRLDFLQAPPLAEIDALTEHFRVSDDQLPGTVEGRGKRFTQTIRAIDANVTEIPPIPFAYFDPRSESYKVATSEAIPIKVEASAPMTSSQIVGDQVEDSAGTGQLTRVREGMQGNYTNVDRVLVAQGFNPGVASGAVAVGAPLVYLLTVILQWRKRHLEVNSSAVRGRRARREAFQRLAVADNAERSEAVAAVEAGLLGYVADRLDLPRGGMTRADAVAALDGAGAADEDVEALNSILAECEAGRYGGLADGAPADLARRGRGLLDRLESAKLKAVKS